MPARHGGHLNIFAPMIRRPVGTSLLAMGLAIAGFWAYLLLGVAAFPSMEFPFMAVYVQLPGASAQTMANTVVAPLERHLGRLPGVAHMFSNSIEGNGQISLQLNFGRSPDKMARDVQAAINAALPDLPQLPSPPAYFKADSSQIPILLVSLTSTSLPPDKLYDLTDTLLKPAVAQIPGVGLVDVGGGAPHAVRVALNTAALAHAGITANDVANALRAANVTSPQGSLGSGATQMTVTANDSLHSAHDFARLVIASRKGVPVRLSDVAAVTDGQQDKYAAAWFNEHRAVVLRITKRPEANAVATVQAIRARLPELRNLLPADVKITPIFDLTPTTLSALHEVEVALLMSIVMVAVVMLVFLRRRRPTIIAMFSVPLSLAGAFITMWLLGFTLNIFSLVALVLCVGFVVDDAIVVIENVERLMTEENLSPREATRKGMGQISGAIVAITVVLAAVFIPSSLQPGASGIIYRQFALTIVVSLLFSAFLALTFTPALCASLLRPEHEKKKNIVFRKFNDFFGWTHRTYSGHIASAVHHAPRWMAVFAVVTVLAGFLYTRLPGSFLPDEDQGYAMAIVQLPPGASKTRTQAVMRQMYAVLSKDQAVDGMLQVTGFSFQGSGENAGMAFIKLKDWSERSESAMQFIRNANTQLRQQIRDAQIFIVNVPTVSGLGQFGGFDMFLEDRGGSGRPALDQAVGTLLAKAGQDKVLSGVHPNELPPAPQLQLSVDRLQAASMGLSIGDISNAISLMLAPVYVNDFTYGGRVKRVMMQAAAPYRMSEAAFGHFFTPSSGGTNPDGTPAMIPISNVVHGTWEMVAPSLTRFNGYPATEIVGSPAQGYASGDAMKAMQQIVTRDLPHGFGYDWTGQSYQELLSGNAATMLMALSILVVFLALAALYESWSIPVAVLLIVPLTMLGTVVFTMARGLTNDIYFMIGLTTVIGLAAKNAILIVEYAIDEQKLGKTLREGVIEAAKLRFRPILMTSLAFILGVFPLFVSSGAGANARHAIGTGVIGGMLFATFFGLLLIPVFYVTVRRLAGDKLDVAGAGQEKPPAT